MNLTSWIVLVSCLVFGLVMAWLAWWTYAWIVNRRYQERLHRRLVEKKPLDAFRMWEIATTPSVPPHPLWAVGPSQTQSVEPSDGWLNVNLGMEPTPPLTMSRPRMADDSKSTDQPGPDTSSENTDGRGVSSSWTTP
jgi:hypothetical protein